jgi:hypothetical protein
MIYRKNESGLRVTSLKDKNGERLDEQNSGLRWQVTVLQQIKETR